jgi:hypothetical protein
LSTTQKRPHSRDLWGNMSKKKATQTERFNENVAAKNGKRTYEAVYGASDVARMMGCRTYDVTWAFNWPAPQYKYLQVECPIVGRNGNRGGVRIIFHSQLEAVIAMVKERGYQPWDWENNRPAKD